MTLPSIISRNQAQVNSDITIKGNENTIGSTVTTLYTVPAGKKTVVKSGAARFVSGGANALLEVLVGGERVHRETAAPSPPILQDIGTIKGMTMEAAETIQLQGDSGSNNGSMNFSFTLTELPA